MNRRNQGFTLVELIIVVAIIGILSTLGLNSYADILAKARDTKRKADLREVQVALQQYYVEYGTFQVANSGYSNGGNGWLSYVGGAYTTSVVQALYAEGFLERDDIEDPMQDPGYMIYLCEGGQVYSLSATLERPKDEDIDFAENHTCNGDGSNGTVTRYGKNFAVTNKSD